MNILFLSYRFRDMDYLLWLLVIIVAAVMIYTMIPPSDKKARERVERRRATWTPPPKPEPVKTCDAEKELAKFYKPAKKEVPVDFPRKPVGACPYSRSQKQDLPLANVPMCIAQKSDTMKLSA